MVFRYASSLVSNIDLLQIGSPNGRHVLKGTVKSKPTVSDRENSDEHSLELTSDERDGPATYCPTAIGLYVGERGPIIWLVS